MDISEKKYHLKKAKTHKGRVHIQSKLPKLIEDPKKAIFLNSENSSEIMRLVMNEFYTTRKSYSHKLGKKNKLACVFEKTDDVEYFVQKEDASLFVYSTDSKKRPMNIVFGNCYEHKLLDAFEFEVSNFIPHNYMENKVNYEINSMPIMIFQGESFETDKVFERIKKFFLDFYTQDSLEEVNIPDLKRIIVFSVDEKQKKIKIRNYQTSEPVGEYSYKNIQIEECGPSFDLLPRRNHLIGDDEYKKACRQPKLTAEENTKNLINTMLDVQGKVYISKQNLNVAALKRYDKILNKKKKTNVEALELLNKKPNDDDHEEYEEGDDDFEDDEDEVNEDYEDDDEEEEPKEQQKRSSKKTSSKKREEE